jgi:hypothetical protein
MLLQILAGLACAMGALLQFAAHRSPDIHDSPLLSTARKVTIAGLTTAALFIFHGLLTEGYVSAPACLSAGLLGMGQMLFAMNKLFPYLNDLHKAAVEKLHHDSHA